MARGNEIIVSANPRGVFLEGIVSGTPKPGTCMQIKAATEMVNGRFTYEAYNRDADGNRYPIIVLLPDNLRGKLATEAYADGDRGFFYCPLPGEELNVLKLDVSGTADDFAIGQQLIVDDGTGKVLGTTGSPEAEPFICLETITDPTTDQLVHVMFTGC
jgi:hypothetical protein